MATNGLGCLIMTAVIDPSFRERLLAEPADIVTDFDLTDEEQKALTSIRAGSFPEFADQLDRWLEQRDLFSRGTRSEDGVREFRAEASQDLAVNGSSPGDRANDRGRSVSDSRPLSIELPETLQTDSDEHVPEELSVALPVNLPEPR